MKSQKFFPRSWLVNKVSKFFHVAVFGPLKPNVMLHTCACVGTLLLRFVISRCLECWFEMLKSFTSCPFSRSIRSRSSFSYCKSKVLFINCSSRSVIRPLFSVSFASSSRSRARVCFATFLRLSFAFSSSRVRRINVFSFSCNLHCNLINPTRYYHMIRFHYTWEFPVLSNAFQQFRHFFLKTCFKIINFRRQCFHIGLLDTYNIISFLELFFSICQIFRAHFSFSLIVFCNASRLGKLLF